MCLMYVVHGPSCREGGSVCIYTPYIYLSAFIPHDAANLAVYRIKCSSLGNSNSVVTNCYMLLLILNIESVDLKLCLPMLQLNFSILTSLILISPCIFEVVCCHQYDMLINKLLLYYSCSHLVKYTGQICQ